MDIADVSKNTKLLIDGVVYNVDEVEFMKPGKGRAIYRLQLRNLLDGSALARTYHSGDKAEEAHVTTEEHQYLYKEDDNYVFMNTKNFEQLFIAGAILGDKKHFLKEGTIVNVTMLGDRPIDVILPTFVELKLVESEAVGRKETFTAQTKSAVLETGYTIEVPIFVEEGEVIKVDTRTGTYVERVSTRK